MHHDRRVKPTPASPPAPAEPQSAIETMILDLGGMRDAERIREVVHRRQRVVGRPVG